MVAGRKEVGMTDDWTLVFDGWDPADEGRREALCTLGNGRFATRGAVPESAADGVGYPGTYAAGCYNRLGDQINGQSVDNESMVNLPNWLDLRFAVGDGEWISMSRVRVLQHRVELDLRRGVLSRQVRFVDEAGRHLSVRQRRLVHMAQPHLAALHTSFTAEDWSGRLRVASGIDGAVANTGVARYRGMASRHLDIARTAQPDPHTVLLVARTTQSQLRVGQAARTRVCRDGKPDELPRLLRQQATRIAHELELQVRAGEPVVVEKVVALVTSRDVAVSDPAATAVELLAGAPGFEELLDSHELAWRQLWRRFRVDLTDGGGPATVEIERALRLSVFQDRKSVV